MVRTAPEVHQLKQIYRLKKKEILLRLREFEKQWAAGNDEEIFAELAFCLLTPQSKAKSCWEALLTIRKKDLLLRGSADQIKKSLHGVRFHNKKAQYLVEARTLFWKNGSITIKRVLVRFGEVRECREWLVNNIRGIGYKEASHFLRNVGLGERIAILDRHILRNLARFGVIEEFPESLSGSKYLAIEEKMAGFARSVEIPLSHLDLLFWYKETGEIFK